MPVLSGVVESWAAEALRHAEFEVLPNGRVFARVPGWPGVVAPGAEEREAAEQLSGVLEDWALLGMRLHDEIPALGEAGE